MPHHWIALDGNTPVPWDQISGDPDAFYEQVEATVTRYHGTLLDMCWALGKKRAYILVDGPQDPAEVKASGRRAPDDRRRRPAGETKLSGLGSAKLRRLGGRRQQRLARPHVAACTHRAMEDERRTELDVGLRAAP